MPNYNLNQLYTFYLVVANKSFSKAAERLCLTEPAVSIQVKALEDSLGCKLLLRSPKRFGLTEMGKVIFRYAEQLYGLVSELDAVIQRQSGARNAFLSVGTTKFLASTLFPQLLNVYLHLEPRISVRIEEGSSMKIIDGLAEGSVELAIIGRIPYSANLVEWQEFTTVAVYPFASPSSHLLKKSLTIADLNKEPLIVRDRDSAIRFNTIAKMSTVSIKPKVMIESGSTDLIKEFVKQNRGYSFLPWYSIEEEVKSGELVILEVPHLKVSTPVDIVYLKGKELSVDAERFLKFLHEIKRPTLEETVEHLNRLNSNQNYLIRNG